MTSHRSPLLSLQSAPGEAGPWYVRLESPPEPERAFQAVADRDGVLFLDSADTASPQGRFSFLTWEPEARIETSVDEPAPLAALTEVLRGRRAVAIPDLPPFQGGLAGLFSYDLSRRLERVPPPRFRDLELPAVSLGIYDTVVAWDHRAQTAWIISHGGSSGDVSARKEQAARKIAAACEAIVQEPKPKPWRRPQPSLELAQSQRVAGYDELFSNLSRDGFLKAVAAGIEAIRAGDIFQVNLSHRLALAARADSIELYARMRRRNPAPFACYMEGGAWQLVSASPERLVRVAGGAVESRPIKGTTQRTSYPEADLPAAFSLRRSPKDRAENVMIVDLLRNDLSRVCEPDSIRVSQLCEIERYRFVQHLVSVIEGRLASGRSSVDVVASLFPGGSITGAPKVRAMELIAELEPTPRGAYCGSVGYLGFDGTADLNILIRTVTVSGGWWTFPVGGGIVVASEPEHELSETWHKARGLLRAMDVNA